MKRDLTPNVPLSATEAEALNILRQAYPSAGWELLAKPHPQACALFLALHPPAGDTLGWFVRQDGTGWATMVVWGEQLDMEDASALGDVQALVALAPLVARPVRGGARC